MQHLVKTADIDLEPNQRGAGDAQVYKGRTLFLTYNGEWGVIDHAALPEAVSPNAEVDDLAKVLAATPAVQRLKSEVESFCVALQRGLIADAWAWSIEVCGRTWQRTQVIRVHLHLWMAVPSGNVEAKLLIDPDYVGRRPAIVAGAQQALRDGFSFARREFGQAVAASEVIALLQELEGVVAVELTRCYMHGADPKPNVALEAQPARFDGNRLYPAQLLMINPTPDTGIQLNWEIAP